MTDRKKIITEAKKWLGARWHHAACVPYIAVDCAQFLADVYSTVGLIDPPDYSNYPRDWASHRNEEWFIKTVSDYAHEVETPQTGDVALWKIGRTFSHGAIIIDYPRIIHADMREGVVMANVSSGFLSRRAVKFYSVFKD